MPISVVRRLRGLRRRPTPPPFPPDFPLFTVVGWAAHRSASSRGSDYTAERGTVITDTAVDHWSIDTDATIEVESSRADGDRPTRAEERRRATFNTVGEFVHRRPDLDESTWSDEADRILTEIENGTRRWLTTTIDVDDVPIEFDLLDFDDDVWAAVGGTANADVTISARGMPRHGLKFGTVTGYAVARGR